VTLRQTLTFSFTLSWCYWY